MKLTKKNASISGFLPLEDVLPAVRDSLLPDDIVYIEGTPYVFWDKNKKEEWDIVFTPDFDL